MRISLSEDSILATTADLLVVGVRSNKPAKDETLKRLDKALGAGFVEKVAAAEGFEGKPGQSLRFPARGRVKAGWVMLIGLGGKPGRDDNRRLGVAAAKGSKRQKTAAVLPMNEDASAVRDITEGLLSGGYRYTKYKTGSRKPKGGLRSAWVLVGSKKDKALKQAIKHGKGVGGAVNLVRDLVNGPPNDINPIGLAEAASAAAEAAGNVTCTVYDENFITVERMALFLAVNAGAKTPPRMLHLVYTPKDADENTKRVAFVGKGLTFDAGGLCLKPAGSMLDMKCDMAGGATTLGIILGAAALDLPIEVHAVIGCTENLLGAEAYRPSDVYTSREGKTVEIINTDAEGRLVLADILDWTTELEPDYMIDHATLTGACMVALGMQRAALYSNDPELGDAYEAAAEEAGEMYWQMPLDSALRSGLKSNVADLKHTGPRWGGSITAALFLKEFVGKTKWAHLDIAGPAYLDSPKWRYPKGGTGFGVATGVKFLERLARPADADADA